jgi:uncharacterized cofD-like protein
MAGTPADIIKIGNSKGIRIPKTLLQQTNIDGQVELDVVGGQLLIRPQGAQPTARSSQPRVGVKAVVIGGGTGSFMLLSALRHYVGSLTAIVNMSDDGGSTGILRDELGVLPPGDIRQCLVALSNTPEYMRELFNYRFDEGAFKGHAFGNLFLTALEKVSGNFGDGVKLAEQILNVGGRVIPVTTENVRLVATLGQQRLEGQAVIELHQFKPGERPRLALEPQPRLNPEAAAAIAEADLVVVAPGALYGSILPVLLPQGMGEALRSTAAIKVFVSNLVNKPHTTAGMQVHEYIEELERHLNQPDLFTYVLYNTAQPSKPQAAKYLDDGELPVEFTPAAFGPHHYRAIGEPLLAQGGIDPQTVNSIMPHSLIRHDGDRLARTLMRIYFS